MKDSSSSGIYFEDCCYILKIDIMVLLVVSQRTLSTLHTYTNTHLHQHTPTPTHTYKRPQHIYRLLRTAHNKDIGDHSGRPTGSQTDRQTMFRDRSNVFMRCLIRNSKLRSLVSVLLIHAGRSRQRRSGLQ